MSQNGNSRHSGNVTRRSLRSRAGARRHGYASRPYVRAGSPASRSGKSGASCTRLLPNREAGTRARNEPSGRSGRGMARRSSKGNANPMGAARSLTSRERNSRNDAEIPRGSLDMRKCSDMLARTERTEISAVFGPSPGTPGDPTGPHGNPLEGLVMGPSAGWEMRSRRSRPGMQAEPRRGASASRSFAPRRRLHPQGAPHLLLAMCVRARVGLRGRLVGPLELRSLAGDLRSVGGTSLATRALQVVPRLDLEPLYGEGAR